MTFVAVPIFVDAPDRVGDALEHARSAAERGADLVEWRVDALPTAEGDAAAAIRRLVKESPIPCIVTCRSAEEGGRYDGREADRLAFLESVAQLDDPPRFIDVELASWPYANRLRDILQSKLDHPPGLILSAHDFEGRPRDLLQRLERMAEEPLCRVIKLAWRAKSLRDNLEAFELLAQRPGPMIALCMGPFGLPSRLLAPKFNGFLTFAALDEDAASAPGQPTLDELLAGDRFRQIGRATGVYGVIGWPVAHSLSPVLHNAGFASVEHDGVYLPLPVPPEYEHFKATVGAFIDEPGLDFRGASVTIPHKTNLLRFVAERGGRIDPLTEAIGAANTLIVGSAGRLEARNTDAPAAANALAEAYDDGLAGLRDQRVAILGTGGAARAIAIALLDAGAKIALFNREKAKADRLADELREKATALELPGTIAGGKPDALDCGCFDVFINATPVGMAGGPDAEGNPLESIAGRAVELADSVVVFDTVYTPVRTPLIIAAERVGARAVTGERMFFAQAALQFEAWTGKKLPEEMLKSLGI